MVYIHVPFCRSFCIYCDFYSETACGRRGDAQIGRYSSELLSEIERRRQEILDTAGLNTLYIGGGTPSVLPLSVLEQTVSALGCGPFEEFTIEVNPEDIVERGPDYVRSLLALGVNRVSMGVQSLDDGILRWMRRRHDASGARRAFGVLRDSGVDNISVDMIFGFPALSEAILDSTLDEIISWCPDHISAYQLSIEEGSALAAQVRDGRFEEASESLCSGQYSWICRRLSAAGYEHYEVSNWALPGHRALHNSAYWTRRPYVGLGPGAHSFDGKCRRANSQTLSGWTASVETLSGQEEREERIMLGLRTSDGIPESLCDAVAASRLVGEGALVRILDASSQPRLRIPEEKFFVSDSIIEELI